jgi:hypothetical protein
LALIPTSVSLTCVVTFATPKTAASMPKSKPTLALYSDLPPAVARFASALAFANSSVLSALSLPVTDLTNSEIALS